MRTPPSAISDPTGAAIPGAKITLTGPGGVGKTRLAAEVSGRLVGGAWFVELAPVTEATEVAYAVLDTLGIREQIIFPEINFDQVDKIKGLNVSIVTSARTDDHGRALLKVLGMPFRSL